jgi:integrase
MQGVMRWGYVMAKTPTRPGIYRLKSGGFFVRSRVTDKKSGKRREVSAALHDAKTVMEAQRELDALVADARAALRGQKRSKQLWSVFAASQLEERVDKGIIESAATLERWQDALDDYLIPAFGHLEAGEVTRGHIDTWLSETVLPWMKKGKLIQRRRKKDRTPIGKPLLVKLAPSTVNGILRILATLCEAARLKFDLARSAFDGIDFLPEGRVYTREQPNSLSPDTVPKFLALARTKYPQHYLMILMGFVTGARPGELRAIRRKGPSADLNWETGVVDIRRSHSRGHVVMDRTKTKTDRTIALPPSLLLEAERHVANLPPKAKASDLLFPTDEGGLRSRNVLAKPFKAIVTELGLGIRVTPRAMRRTFNDLAREIGLEAVLTRSISGHTDERMQIHYSTARDHEQRTALEKVSAAIIEEPALGGRKGGTRDGDVS